MCCSGAFPGLRVGSCVQRLSAVYRLRGSPVGCFGFASRAQGSLDS